MSSVRFRIVLPALMTVIHLMLWGWSSHETVRRAEVHMSLAGGYKRVALLDPAPEVAFMPAERRLGNATRVAIVLDLPSFIAGSILASYRNSESEPAILGFSTLFAPLLWFRIGSWIDRRLGHLPIPVRLFPRVWEIGVALLRTTVVFFCFVAVWGMSPLSRYHDTDSYVFWSAILLWSGTYLVCVKWETHALRRRLRAS